MKEKTVGLLHHQTLMHLLRKSKNTLKNYVTVETLYPLKIFEEKIYAFGEVDEYADFRKTLCWKPSLKSNENGELHIEFYTSDMRGAFTGEIDLYSENGRFGYYSFDFMVY